MPGLLRLIGRAGGLSLALGLAGCASSPDARHLCGTWAGEDIREQWWIAGRDLRGEGRIEGEDGEPTVERLRLRAIRGGHAYVVESCGESVRFEPIEPREARYGPRLAGDPPAVEVFSWANYSHDFPQEIHYVLAGDELQAIISGPGRESGWELRRLAACGSEPQP